MVETRIEIERENKTKKLTTLNYRLSNTFLVVAKNTKTKKKTFDLDQFKQRLHKKRQTQMNGKEPTNEMRRRENENRGKKKKEKKKKILYMILITFCFSSLQTNSKHTYI